MPKVEVGQIWQTVTNASAKVRCAVVAIDGDVVSMQAFGTGRKFSLSRRRMESRGPRAVRLLRYADGTEVEKRPLVLAPVSHEEARLASSLVKTKAPRGIVHASEEDRMALRLFTGGMQIKAIAARFGVSKHTIAGRLTRARQAIRDAQTLVIACGSQVGMPMGRE